MGRTKPKTPEQIAAEKARGATLATNRAEARRLRAQGLEVTVDSRTEEVLGARRKDVVQVMAEKRTLTADQVQHYRDLERMLQDASEGSRCCLSSLDRVQGAGDSDGALQRRISAIKKLAARQGLIDAASWGMLDELASGGGLLTRWRAVVERRTGETDPHAQGGAVRQVIRALESAEIVLAKDRGSRTNFIGDMIGRAEEAA